MICPDIAPTSRQVFAPTDLAPTFMRTNWLRAVVEIVAQACSPFYRTIIVLFISFSDKLSFSRLLETSLPDTNSRTSLKGWTKGQRGGRIIRCSRVANNFSGKDMRCPFLHSSFPFPVLCCVQDTLSRSGMTFNSRALDGIRGEVAHLRRSVLCVSEGNSLDAPSWLKK